MPQPLAGGDFGDGRINAGQTTEWMRFILHKLGVPLSQLVNVGSHSCKATLLSWCAKAGVSRDDRRILGYHATPGDSSVDAYARDIQAAPLAALARLLTMIRNGIFLPDETRSGRWARSAGHKPLNMELNVVEVEEVECVACGKDVGEEWTMCQCGAKGHWSAPCWIKCENQGCGLAACAKCFEAHRVECDAKHDDASEASDSDTSDSDCEKAAMVLAEERKCMGEKALVSVKFERGLYVVHSTFKTVHAANDGVPLCNANADPSKYERAVGDDVVGLPRCGRAACVLAFGEL